MPISTGTCRRPSDLGTGRHPLPAPEAFAGLLAALGIGNDTQVIAYDDANGSFAARLWWMLRWLGHGAVAVLDGGFKAWIARTAARVEAGEAAGRPPTRSRLYARSLRPQGRGEHRRSRARACAIRGASAGRCARAGTLCRHGRAHRSRGRTRARRGESSVHRQSRRRTVVFCPPRELGRRWQERLARHGAAECGRHVRLRRHRLPQFAEPRGRPVCRGGKLYAGSWSEWIRDPRTARRARSLGAPLPTAGRRISQRRHLHAAPICYGARDMNTPAKLLPVPTTPGKSKSRWICTRSKPGARATFRSTRTGHVVIRPSMDAAREIDLYDVVQGLKARDLHTPVVIRFSDILAHRLRHLAEAFGTAIAENDYKNRYAAVFPIKVNQQRLVVEEVYRYGKEFGFGLEVGSKPELLAVMSITENAPDRIVVCNGFKDDSYIEAVILATKLGRTIIPVVENYEEIHLILKHAERYGVRPKIGVRVKLASEGAGRWRESAGEKSKFGLFISEILDLYALLKERNMLDCLQLVHCHPGSQLQDIRRVKDAINELAHVYAELKIMGAGLQYIDIGGGLGVDYDGSGTNFESSMNYTLNEYASDVVYRIKSVCDARDVPHPMIVSESGRAIAAHHSLLVFDILGCSKLDQFKVTGRPDEDYHGKEEVPQPVRDLFDSYRSVNERRLVECYHDGLQAREQALQMFNLGYLSLEFRALAEKLYWATCTKIRDYCRKLDRVPEELENLEDMLSDIYFCNFSVFQSLPDSWAIGQLFPIMPIQRLGERPIAQCRAGRHHLRFRRQDRSLRASSARPNARWRCTN